MRKVKVNFGLIAFFAIFYCFSFTYDHIIEVDYNLDKPLEKIELPKVLHEISGLTDWGPTSIACVQDEEGVIFIYDFVEKAITKVIKFAEEGDFEGITKVGDDIYVLRSDGVLFMVVIQEDDDVVVEEIRTSILASNNEALCYDESNNRLLIGSKVKSGKGSDLNVRHIYAFNLATDSMDVEPALALNKSDIINFVRKNNIKLPLKQHKKTGEYNIDLKLAVSGISIHPISKNLYVLCAMDYLLLEYDRNGKLKNVQLLNKIIFPQAEGITFYENGDLIISNEGQDGQPTLLRFGH